MEYLKSIKDKNEKQGIAIIGMACRFPEADDINSFWENMTKGTVSINRMPSNRRHDLGEVAKEYLKAGYLDDIAGFDYSFFGISYRDAMLMDPSQRIFLEVAWNAIEDSGYLENISGTRTGLFLGYGGDMNYLRMINQYVPSLKDVAITGNVKSIISGRIAHMLDLKGPAINLDTACSSSLVAVHMACKAIENGECDIAIAGGLRIICNPEEMDMHLGIISPSQKISPFSADADGTVWGEGAGAIILKRYEDAVRDNDRIYAVIKGSAVNNDGKSIGIIAPSRSSQEELLVEAWKNAAINPEDISYIESHGTGTQIGDAIEVDAVKRAFRRFTDKKGFCHFGTLKANIGHGMECGGIAAIIKAALCLKNSILPMNAGFGEVDPEIYDEASPIYFKKETTEWTNDTKICGVSSFGFNGTNCHVILKESPFRVEKTYNVYAFNRKRCWITDALTETGVKLCGRENERYLINEIIVANAIKKYTGKEIIDIYENISHEGIDSIVLVKILEEINLSVKNPVSLSDLFQFKNVYEIAKFISKRENVGVDGSSIENSKTAKFIDTGIQQTFEKDPIAVVGMSVNVPGASTLEEFWQLIREGKSSIGVFPEERKKDIRVFLEKNLGKKIEEIPFDKGSYFKSISEFDYKFYHLSKNEAVSMDPHQRFMLNEAVKAIWDSGYDISELNGKNIGVYIGASTGLIMNYIRILYEGNSSSSATSIIGNHPSVISGRISNFMNLRGPAITVDTACSSSMTALEMACEAIEAGKCESALVGGVHFEMAPIDEKVRKIGVESSSGKLRAFDEKSDGVLWGEGAGALFIKRLSNAKASGDHIYAIIRGHAINQDGSTLDITAPNVNAQRDVICEAWEKSGVNPTQISYIEAHGTGTEVGDAVEVEGLRQAFSKYTDKKQFCALSSLKPNIGHTEAASGVLSTIKAVLVLTHGMVPPMAEMTMPNTKLNFINSPLFPSAYRNELSKDPLDRFCGVSSFGFSGTNNHILLQGYLNSGSTRKCIIGSFLEERCWPSEKGIEAIGSYTIIGKSSDPEIEMPLIEIWANRLGNHEIFMDKTFFEQGGHSLIGMLIVGDIQKKWDVDINYGDLCDCPDIPSMAALIRKKGIGTANAVDMKHDVEHEFDPFPLTAIQKAYLVGRQNNIVLGNNGTHIYMEIETEFDMVRLEEALQYVIEKNSMMRTVINLDGTQQVLKSVPKYKIMITDVSGLPDEKKNGAILTKREKLSHHKMDVGNWPMFEVSAVRVDEKKSILFFGIDALLVDGISLFLIGNEILEAYNKKLFQKSLMGESDELDYYVPDITMRDCVMLDGIVVDSKKRLEDKKYWDEWRKTMPQAPKMNYAMKIEEVITPHFKRKTMKLMPDEWRQIKVLSQRIGVSPAVFICGVYAQILGYWCNQDQITLNFTTFSRNMKVKDIERVIGEFTSVMPIGVDLGENIEFEDSIKLLQHSVNDAIKHNSYDGTEVIHDISVERKMVGYPVLPYVFTSMIFDVPFPWTKIGKINYGLSQTPQVCLDCQVITADGGLLINWDYVMELFMPRMIDQMFEQFCELFKHLINEEGNDKDE